MKTTLLGVAIFFASFGVFADGIVLNTTTGDLSTYNTQGNTTTMMDLNSGNLTIFYSFNSR